MLLPSTGSLRVGHDWSDLAAAACCCKRQGFIYFLTQFYFLWLNNIPMCVCIIPSLSGSSTNGRLSCFRAVAIANNAAVTVDVQIAFQVSVFIFFR